MPIVLAYADPPAAVASPARGETAVEPAAAPTKPVWLRKPKGEDIARVYPARALRETKSGAAVMRCGVTADGRQSDCTVIAEDPVGWGFGEAALRLVPLFKMRLPTKDGVPQVGGMINIPIGFHVWN
jgi:periplasmic protein TonB